MKYRNFVYMALAGTMVACIAIASNPFNVDQISIPASANQGSSTSSAVADNSAAKPLSSHIGFVNVRTRLNVRSKPWGKIVGKLYDGDKLKIVAKEGDWLKIEYNGGYAYVHSNYVEVGEERVSGGNTGEDSGSVSDPTSTLPDGTLNPARFGYDAKMFKSVFGLVEKFCSSNKAYVFGAGHKYTSGYAEKTDCSGFVGQFIQKMAAASGVTPVFPKNSWYPSSQVYKTQHTNKITSKFPPPNPRNLIRPGDIFVMNPGSS
ncbi:MAG: Protective antigen SpaA-like protein, partial [uncultured bacterium]